MLSARRTLVEPPSFPYRPGNVEAEQAIIGAILVNNEAYRRVAGFLRPEHFHEPVHGRVFAACARMIEGGRIADPVTLRAEFELDPALAELRGAGYLRDAARAAESIVNAREYALVVADLARTRAALDAQEEFADAAAAGEPSAAALGRLRARLDEIEAGTGDGLRVLLPPEWPRPEAPRLVHGLLGEGWLALVYGEPSAGKSFLAVDLACRIATGEPWRGRAVLRGPVVYVAGERAHSVRARVRAWLLRHGHAAAAAAGDVPVGVLAGPLDLLDPDKDTGRVLAAVRELAERLRQAPRLIVIDTVHAVCPGSEENARDFGSLLFNVRRIASAFGSAVLLVHHSGKDAGRGARGSNALTAAADLEIEVVEEEDGRRQPVVRKLSDGEPCELEPFVIDDVVLERPDGLPPVRSGVHVLAEPAPARDRDDPRRERARELRAQGQSFGAIARASGVPKSTVQRWLR